MTKNLIDEIRDLEEKGILSSELCPTPHFWRWNVLKPDLLPDRIKAIYNEYDEVRWYGGN